MSTFVLVHGSNCGGWVWKKVTPLLRSAGHEVYAPTLTGLSDRSHLLHCGVDLTTHITDIANLLCYEDLEGVILVGNSYGGMVITGVEAVAGQRLRLLVYLDAYVPTAGQSESDLWPPERRAVAEQAEEKGLASPPPLSRFGVYDPELLAWIEPRLTPHPVSTYDEPVPETTGESGVTPRVFIRCTSNPSGTPDVFGPFAQTARQVGWIVHDLAAGHLAMLTAPRELAQLLIRISDNSAAFSF